MATLLAENEIASTQLPATRIPSEHCFTTSDGAPLFYRAGRAAGNLPRKRWCCFTGGTNIRAGGRILSTAWVHAGVYLVFCLGCTRAWAFVW